MRPNAAVKPALTGPCLCGCIPQVVVAGASETGLACLEHLLVQPSLRFTNITLLAPGGIHSDSLGSQFTAQRIAQLGLHASVTMVDSHIVALDPEQQLLVLADGSQLPYDLLTVVTGLQVSTQHAGQQEGLPSCCGRK